VRDGFEAASVQILLYILLAFLKDLKYILKPTL
jgi:hypothetical protein